MASNYKSLCSKDDLVYTSCYCEENIWKLLENLINKNNISDDLYAVFISNKNRSIPIWYQRSSEDNETPVIWDYHVIAIHKDPTLKTSYVYDLDTILNFPESFRNYSDKALPILADVYKKFHRVYRVIPAKYYIENFSSDRSHMINKETGQYMSPPPDYPCIQSKESNNNIQDFISMDLDDKVNELETKHGILMNEIGFRNFFTVK